MRIQTQDGLTLSGTAEQIVGYLRAHSQTPSASCAAWMAETAQRVMLWNQTAVSTVSAHTFLRTVADAGLLTILQDNDQLCLFFE